MYAVQEYRTLYGILLQAIKYSRFSIEIYSILYDVHAVHYTTL